MKLRSVTAIITFLVILQPLQAGNVVGYFINWGIYGDRPYTAQDVPYDKLTHIQYAFFLPETDGTIVSSDEDADEQILLGDKIWWPEETHDSTTSLVHLAHQNNVKVLASVGGWTGSENFPAMAGSAQTRSRFCSSARALIEQYNFDGIDIDWEYPGFTDHNGTPQDAQNFVLLLDELRDTLDAMPGERKMITLAISGGSHHGQNFLIEEFQEDVDYISIMTYDYTGAWGEGDSWHNSPLYDYGSSDNWSVDRAMEYYISRGVPASKFNIGMAFYGRTFADCQGPNTSYTGPGSGEEPGMIYYSSVAEKLADGSYSYCWDEQAKVPYCLSADGEYCSYDDTASVRMKAQYCMDKGYGGAIIWELKSDFMADGSQPLLAAAANTLLQQTTPVKRVRKPQGLGFVCDNRSGKTKIRFSLAKGADLSLSLFDLSGRAVYTYNRKFSRGKHSFILPVGKNLAAGNYLLRMEKEDRVHTSSFTVSK
ncbi:MAG: glycosyl hydrolase family 18 protein [Chitinispirillaceae bacterium]